MATTNNIKVGSYLIDSNQVYSVYKIVDDRLYYRPAVSGGNHPSVTGSIPAANAAMAGFRPLLNADEIKDFADTENCGSIFSWQKKFTEH